MFNRLGLGCVMVLAAVARVVGATEAINLGTDRELFVDLHLISELRGVRLKLNEPRRVGIALMFDRPWEGAFCAYITVIKDGERIIAACPTSPKAT